MPETVTVTADRDVFARAEVVLLAVPMQALGGFVEANAALFGGKWLVACCKGVDLSTLTGPLAVIRATCPTSTPAILTGPSFAADIARGLPTALTLEFRSAQCLTAMCSIASSTTALWSDMLR